MNSADLSPDIRAALLCDIPKLWQSTPGAKAFVDMMSLRPLREQPDDAAGEPLMRAALGLQAELNGSIDEASGHYRSLLELGSGERLLGLALLAWMPSENPEHALEAARAAADGVADSQLRVHYMCKLMTFALDRGLRSLGETYYDIALQHADATPGLRDVLDTVGFNIFRRPITSGPPYTPRDDLVDLPWIRERLESANRHSLVEVVKGLAASPWTYRIRFGSDLPEAQAAEMQAAWAGAIWLFAETRSTIGAQMLTRVHQLNPSQCSYALSMWVLGGGDDISDVVNLVEPRMSANGADELLQGHLLEGRRIGAERSYLQAALALWDVVSDELAAHMIAGLPVAPGEHPEADRSRDLFNLLGLRAPEAWIESLSQKPGDVQAGLLTQIQPLVTSLVSQEVTISLAPRLIDAWRQDPRAINAATASVVIVERLQDPTLSAQVDDLISSAPPEVRVIVYDRTKSLRMLPNAADVVALIGHVESANAQALLGSVGIGGYNVRALLGRALTVMPDAPERGLEILFSTARDVRLPADFRYDAVESLRAIARTRPLPADAIADIPAWQPTLIPSFFPNVTPALFNAAILTLRSEVGIEDHLADLAVLLRDTDPRIRHTAAAALGPLISRNRVFVSSLIVSALFDPTDAVVLEALSSVRAGAMLDPVTLPVVQSRLAALYSTGSRDVRLGVVTTARDLLRRDPTLPLQAIITQAAIDRSWRVRFALLTDPDDS
jgi:hypothetical protein